jgi:hypothetical protein
LLRFSSPRSPAQSHFWTSLSMSGLAMGPAALRHISRVQEAL